MLTVMVVDDDPLMCEAVEVALTGQGNAVAVMIGIVAVQAARAWQPHVILLDLAMPNVWGSAMGRCLRAALSQRIFLSSP